LTVGFADAAEEDGEFIVSRKVLGVWVWRQKERA
jgi:hypothetical protein